IVSIDNEAPIVRVIKDLTFKVNQNYNLSEHFYITDNKSQSDKISVIYVDNIVISEIGSFLIKVIATDEAGNETIEDFTANVVDKNGPEISIKKELRFNVNEPLNLNEFFLALDDIDKDVTYKMTYDLVDLSFVGLQKIKVSVSDSNNNNTTSVFDCKVVDELAPLIVLSKTEVNINLSEFDNLNYNFFKLLVTTVIDNYDNLSINSIKIDMKELVQFKGEYTVYYEISDSSNNTYITQLKVVITSDEKTYIKSNNILVKKNNKIDFSKYIILENENTSNTRLVIDDSMVDTTKSGVYYISAMLFIDDNHIETKYIRVEVESDYRVFLYSSLALLLVGASIISFYFIKKRKTRDIINLE
ncbi:MAG: hypothetical protein ACRC5M_02420, partial [Anaeroplasmataceae bacterium]